MKEIICVDNLTKDYGNNKGIFDVSININKGQAFGFLGPNGAGKTTTIRNLMGFISPDKGKCFINGLECFDNREIIQKDIGYIPGETAFISDMTGIEFIKFMADLRGLNNINRANELIKIFDLDPKPKIKKMSKGMKQKIGIIIALMHDPEILILDEPTSGLDPLMQNVFINLILEEKKKGKTILLSSHMFEEVERICDFVSIIKEGRIITTDTIDNLKKSKSKKYTLTFSDEKDIKKFTKEKIEIIDISNNRVTILVKNNFKDFINLLGKYSIIDLDEEMQSLEDIFLKYYGGDENDK